MTAEIIKAIGKRQVLRNHTPVVANVTTMFDWEVDLFSVNKNGMTYEFEVKISRADFLKDKKKKKWSMFEWKKKTKLPNYMAYACPSELIAIDELPPLCGLYYYENGEIVEIKKPVQIHDVVKDFNEINFKIARMYSQRHFLGRTLISHINLGIKERNAERMKEHDKNRIAQQEMMDAWRKKKEIEQNNNQSVSP